MPKIDKLIRVTSQITGGGVLRRELGISLFMTTDSSYLGTGSNRIVNTADSDDVSAVFEVGVEPRTAGDIYYQQSPFPKNLIFGRWINEDIAAELLGQNFESTFVILNAIADGEFACLGEDFTGINLTGASDLAGIATLIETELQTSAQASLANSACTFNVGKNRFEVTSGTEVGAAAVLTVFSTIAAPTGTDISGLLGLDEGAILNQGADEETISDALDACIFLDDSPYFIETERTIVDYDTINEVSVWVASREYMYFVDNLEAAALNTGETTSVLYQLSLLEYPRDVAMWSETGDYKALSFAGRYSAVNFNGSNTVITGNLKQLPGTLSDNLTTTQVTELESKFSNYYAPWFSTGSDPVNGVYNGTTMKSLVWADVRYYLDWNVNAVRVDVFNLLYNSNIVPQTEPGVAAIYGVIDAVMQQGITNGGIAPGQLSAAATLDVQLSTDNPDFDGYLTSGYLIYATPLADQSQSDRNLRKSPPFKVWMKGSGAIHSVEIALIFEN